MKMGALTAAGLLILTGCTTVTAPATSQATTSASSSGYALPDRTLTPGAVMTTDVTIICTTSTETRRNVTAAAKTRVYTAYHITDRTGWVIDHLIPLEAGGDNTDANLWPQKASEAKVKDRVENAAHDAICDRHLPPAQVQADIAANWVTAIDKYGQAAQRTPGDQP